MMPFKNKKIYNREIDPDEIFLDSSNLPDFDRHQFEGRIERTLRVSPFLGVGIFFAGIIAVFSWQSADLQITRADYFENASEDNSLRNTIIWNERGIMSDRNGVKLAENIPNISPDDFSLRSYADISGIAHVVGYVGYPAKDKDGNFYQKEFEGKDGVERFYGETIAGAYGIKIVETNAFGGRESESTIRPPVNGEDIELSIDSRVSEALFEFIKHTAEQFNFLGGAGVIMDVDNGEILALVNFPEYEPSILTSGTDRQKVKGFVSDSRMPFLNRVVSGLYTPGSIVKPFVALAALNENVIGEYDQILSTGSISIPHPYIEGQESVFKDWKAHGLVDMRSALAHSSNVYFYEVGGGFSSSDGKNQKGLGISKIEQYMRIFGFGKESGVDLYGEAVGVIPSPEWKKEIFNDEWRVGDTYNTAIGQYGFQITPLQAVRAIAAIANRGWLLAPHLIRENESRSFGVEKDSRIKIKDEYFSVIHEGLRDAVLEGTAGALNISSVSVAGKTGTAEVGTLKKYVNSWVIGFFPYEKPRFAFAVVMERGNPKNLVGASAVMRQTLEWMARETPEYLQWE